jgi:hypothetical protein
VRLEYSNLAIKCIWWMTERYNLTVSSERESYSDRVADYWPVNLKLSAIYSL